MAFYMQPNHKQSTRNKILHLIFRHGPVPRITIAEDHYLTPASVTNNVATLIQEGIVEETGEASDTNDASPGRKRILVDVVAHYAYSIGCELTEKFFTFCLIDLKGNSIYQKIFSPKESDFLHVNDIVVREINTILEMSRIPSEKILGVGIALAGHYSTEHDKFISNNPIWSHFSLKSIQTKLLIPIVCENNVHCMACGEYYFNNTAIPESFNFLHLGRGMFNSTVIDGKLLMGTNFLAGEIGHTIVQPHGSLCECGKQGCLQTYCSETWVIKKAKNIYNTFTSSILRSLVEKEEHISLEHIMLAYEMGDPLVGRVFSDMIDYLSITLSNIMIISNPSKILFHSPIFENEHLKQQLLQATQHHLAFIQTDMSLPFEILPYCIYKGAIGAGALALSSFIISYNSR